MRGTAQPSDKLPPPTWSARTRAGDWQPTLEALVRLGTDDAVRLLVRLSASCGS